MRMDQAMNELRNFVSLYGGSGVQEAFSVVDEHVSRVREKRKRSYLRKKGQQIGAVTIKQKVIETEKVEPTCLIKRLRHKVSALVSSTRIILQVDNVPVMGRTLEGELFTISMEGESALTKKHMLLFAGKDLKKAQSVTVKSMEASKMKNFDTSDPQFVTYMTEEEFYENLVFEPQF